jgi:hypothetical protein
MEGTSTTPGTASSGGGAGSYSTNVGGDGTANTGGGGGGNGGSVVGAGTGASGGAGGSGLVILSIPTSSFSNTYANATITTSGANTIMTFTTSGTYTA